MSVINEEHLNQIREQTILENALSMYSLYKYKFEEGKIELKWLYIKHKEEFIRKFKQKFPDAGDDEIKNFIRIYLKPAFNNEKTICVILCSLIRMVMNGLLIGYAFLEFI